MATTAKKVAGSNDETRTHTYTYTDTHVDTRADIEREENDASRWLPDRRRWKIRKMAEGKGEGNARGSESLRGGGRERSRGRAIVIAAESFCRGIFQNDWAL